VESKWAKTGSNPVQNPVKPDLGPAGPVQNRIWNRMGPWTWSGWHRSETRLQTGRPGQKSGLTGFCAVRGVEPGPRAGCSRGEQRWSGGRALTRQRNCKAGARNWREESNGGAGEIISCANRNLKELCVVARLAGVRTRARPCKLLHAYEWKLAC
jgi:hypothetical protein